MSKQTNKLPKRKRPVDTASAAAQTSDSQSERAAGETGGDGARTAIAVERLAGEVRRESKAAPERRDGLTAGVLGKVVSVAPRAATVLSIAAISWLMLACFPIVPHPPEATGVDAAWNYGLNWAHSHHLVFGRDLLFTFGPLGYLTVPVYGHAEPWAVAFFALACYAAMIYGIVRCGRELGWGLAASVAIVLTIMTLFAKHHPEVWQAGVSAVFIAMIAARRFPVVDLAIAAALSGVTLLIKFNDGVSMYLVFYVILAGRLVIDERTRTVRRAAVALAAVPPLILVGAFTFMYGSPAAIPGYIRGSLEIASGYSESMSVVGPIWQLALALITLAYLVLTTMFVVQKSRRMWFAAAAAAIFAFMWFKHGMVRQDGHADTLQPHLAACALFLMAGCVRGLDRRVFAIFAVTMSMFGPLAMLQSAPYIIDAGRPRLTLKSLWPNMKALAHCGETMQAVAAYHDAQRNALRLPEFDALAGKDSTFDAYPNEMDIIWANRWSLSPRPVFQSYSAYTPTLDRINAEHIARAGARFVLLGTQEIDGRAAYMEDPESFRSLIRNYTVRARSGERALLERRSSPLPESLEYIRSIDPQMDDEIYLPAVGPREAVVLKADVKRTAYGKLATFLLRAPAVRMTITYTNFRHIEVRVVRPNLENGIIVNPVPLNMDHVLPLFTPADVNPESRVYAVRLSFPTEFAARKFHVSLYRMKLPDR